MKIEKVNISEKLAMFSDHWNPRIVGELNGQQVKLAKLNGEFVWHKHEEENELFLLISGKFTMDLRDGPISMEPGEFLIIPRGVEHRPVADGEVHMLLFEPVSTLNTGNLVNERTRKNLEKI